MLDCTTSARSTRRWKTASPSGDGPDLTKLGLIPADGLMLLAAHISRHGTLTEWLDAHRAYHQALVAGGCSPRLRSIANALRDNAELYRMWSRTWAHDVDRDLAAEHRAIMTAAISADADAAAEALSQHIARTTDAIKAFAASAESGG